MHVPIQLGGCGDNIAGFHKDDLETVNIVFSFVECFCVLNTLPGNVLSEMLAVSDSFVDQNGPCCLCTPGYSVSAELLILKRS